jgi:uncharacterized phage protein (TIGR01671 family)
MSREIKFRAWCKSDEGFWIGEQTLNMWPISTLNNGEYTNRIYEQFTGLHDKNGKEIYEGDIVKNHTCHKHEMYFNGKLNELRPPDVVDAIGVVKFDEHWCAFSFTSLSERGELEVIGNVHQNPELLEAGE